MITRLERIGEPWQRKPGPCIPARLTGRIIMASLYRSGEGSRLAWVAPICSNPRARPTGACGNRSCVARCQYPALGHDVRDVSPAQRPR